jgi:antirestriction protein ArdC
MTAYAYQVVTDRIIALLEKGVVPWQKTWNASGGQPRNLVTQREYKGINTFLLNVLGYKSPFWLTFNQAKQLGGFIKAGEKASPVIFWKWLEVEDIAQPGATKHIPFLRYYSVFNLNQCEGINPKLTIVEEEQATLNPIEEAESIVSRMPLLPIIAHGGNRACYSPVLDTVQMPEMNSFKSSENYYSVLFHELIHATGHVSRLNRKGATGTDGEWSSFGSQSYAREELVAEMGAAFLCAEAGIVDCTMENSAAYIKSWLERLKNDNRLVVIAGAQAQKSADFVAGKLPSTEERAVEIEAAA